MENGLVHVSTAGLPSYDIPPIIHWQDVEKVRQLRSHLESILNVAQRLRLRCFHRLRPCWTNFLNILQGGVLFVEDVFIQRHQWYQHGFLHRLLSNEPPR